MELKQSKSENNTRRNCEGKGAGYDMSPGVMVALFSDLVGRKKQQKPRSQNVGVPGREVRTNGRCSPRGRPLVNNFSNRLRLRHVAKNNKREGGWFCDRVCSKKLCRDVYLMNTNHEPENAGDAS